MITKLEPSLVIQWRWPHPHTQLLLRTHIAHRNCLGCGAEDAELEQIKQKLVQRLSLFLCVYVWLHAFSVSLNVSTSLIHFLPHCTIRTASTASISP